MQLSKVLCVALIGLCLAVAVAANVADTETEGEKVAAHDKCGAKGGHCEVASGCGGRALKGLCDDNGSGAVSVCCLPGKKAKKGKGLSPKQLAAKRKARAAAAKKQAKAAAAAGAQMAAQTAMAKALAKDVPAPSGKAVPAQPSPAEAEKAAKEAAALAKAAAPQPPAKAKATAKKLKHKKAKKSKAKKSKAAKKGKGKKKSNTKKLGMRAKKGSRGVDVAQKTGKKHWQCLKKAGWDWAVVRGFRSANRPDPHAARSLKLAAKAGFSRRKLGVYLYPCAKCGDPKGQVDRMIKHLKNAGAHRLFSTIWLDVEGRFWPAPKPTRKQKKAKAAALAVQRAAAVAAAKVNGNSGVVAPPPLVKKQKKSSRYGASRAFFRSLVRACRAHKRYRCGVYTSSAQWKSIMGKRPIGAAKNMPLWYPRFDVTPSAATTDFEGFSGWDKAWAKQYSENQNVCGLSVDVNVRA